MPQLSIGGVVPLSAADLPGCLSAVVFCQGCPWRCGYCHNPHLLPPAANGVQDWSDVAAFLQRRRGLLDAVVFSGGEPTFQRGIGAAMAEVRRMGFKVGLHTAGIYPRRLEALLPDADWIGMDCKAPFDQYDVVTGVRGSGEKVLESVRLVLGSGVECEFRTTVHPDLISAQGLWALAHALADLGVRRYVLQEFRPQGCANHNLRVTSVRGFLDDELCRRLGTLFAEFTVRRAGTM
jgi:pyruvate formate lyase activating enzyme